MVVVAQLGARMHYAVPAILARSGRLERLFTDICAPPLPEPLRAWASRSGPAPLRRWLGRVPSGIPEDKITSFAAMGLEYYWRQRRADTPGALTEGYLWAGKEFCRRVIRKGLGPASSVYTYNSAGLELLQHAQRRGMFAISEQTSAPAAIYDDLLEREQADYPEWVVSLVKDPFRHAYEERERMEWAAADLILCGSEFVRQGIRAKGGPVERCVVVPYGVHPHPQLRPRDLRHKPLRVLTVGAVRMMKGPQYLLNAARMLKGKAEFRVAGQLDVSAYARKILSEHVNLLGVVPRAEVHRQFEWADVFLLSTLCEGSATVCYEALSCGLPVITTPNAGSVVRDGVEGFIVPIRDAAAIGDRIERLANDGHLWAEMSANALARASEFTLEKYGERLLRALRKTERDWLEVGSQTHEVLQ